MADPVSIKIFLTKGHAELLRTAEISNWSGMAFAFSRAELDELNRRKEAAQPGVYFLVGTDSDSGDPCVYVGEAEQIGKRIKQHVKNDNWVQAIVFVSKDQNLTKAHIKYLEGKLIELGTAASGALITNSQSSGARLPEADQAEMDIFLSKMLQLLPVLGTHVFTPRSASASAKRLQCKIKGLVAYGQRTPNGFVVYKGSQAVVESRPSGARAEMRRQKLLGQGTLQSAGDHLVFTRDYEFTSPSVAGTIVTGGATNGLTAWKTERGTTLKELESSE